MWFSDLQIIPLLEVIFALSARPVFILSQWPDVPDQPLVDFYQESLLLETPSLGGAHTCLESWVTEVRFPPFASWASYWEGFPGSSDGKESACKAGDLGLIPGLGKFLEKGMPIQSSILACRIPWTEEPGGLQSMGSPRVRHDWVTNIFIFQDQKTSKWMKYITCGQRGEEQSLWSLQFLCTNY